MRPPTRISAQSRNPYDELAQLADPEPEADGATAGTSRILPPVRGLPSDDGPDPDPWEPPNHRGRGRLRALPAVVKTLVPLVAGAVFLVAADRLAVVYAEDRAAEKIQDTLSLRAEPDVDIKGFPFLTQVARERIDRAEVRLPDVDAGKVSLAEVQATVRGVSTVGELTAPKGVDLQDVRGDVLVSFDDLDRELGASHITFSEAGPAAVRIKGGIDVAGRTIGVRAEARIGLRDGRELSTTVTGMRLDVPGLFTYRPGSGAEGGGLRLHPEAAARISEETARVKALFDVPAVVERLGIPRARVEQALRSERELAELTGSPRFLKQLTEVNLIDLVAEHPWLLEKAGIDPALVGALMKLRLPELSDRLSWSFTLPESLGGVRLRDISVEKEGIRARLTGSGLRLGGGDAGPARASGPLVR
ncbi:DUF2993 domain-containing protein [Streptomyces sp. NPDC005805]|uniref:LmeA family phospholipid-binding protein n=1 Tax=Streptomyces sp. NPDC005805 TaxID=3157068 RepID=UPI0033C82DFE